MSRRRRDECWRVISGEGGLQRSTSIDAIAGILSDTFSANREKQKQWSAFVRLQSSGGPLSPLCATLQGLREAHSPMNSQSCNNLFFCAGISAQPTHPHRGFRDLWWSSAPDGICRGTGRNFRATKRPTLGSWFYPRPVPVKRRNALRMMRIMEVLHPTMFWRRLFV